MTIEENTVVTLSYELKEKDDGGPTLEVMDIAYPFIFFYKSAHILDVFQENLRGLAAGDTFAFVIAFKDAYGGRTASEIVTVPIERFVVDDELADSIRDVGQYVAITDDQGRKYNGKIVEKTATHLKVDLNHAMAGKDLYFKGHILQVRKASVEEIIQKRYIMPDGIRF